MSEQTQQQSSSNEVDFKSLVSNAITKVTTETPVKETTEIEQKTTEVKNETPVVETKEDSKQDLETTFKQLFEKEFQKLQVKPETVEKEEKQKVKPPSIKEIKRLLIEDPATLFEKLELDKEGLTVLAKRAWGHSIGEEDDDVKKSRLLRDQEDDTKAELEELKKRLQQQEDDKYEQEAKGNQEKYKASLKYHLEKLDTKSYPTLNKAIKAGLLDGLVQDGFNMVLQDAVEKIKTDPNYLHMSVETAIKELEKRYAPLLSKFQLADDKLDNEELTLNNHNTSGRQLEPKTTPKTFEEALALAKKKIGKK